MAQMLEYAKLILIKVSFSKNLFEKELRKAIRSLTLADELIQLREWCYEQFAKRYRTLLDRAFAAPALG